VKFYDGCPTSTAHAATGFLPGARLARGSSSGRIAGVPGRRGTFSGVFTGVFTHSPTGPVPPYGRPVAWEVIYRHNQDGRVAEEWVPTDNRSLLEKLAGPSA
jgi:hypothetical protein